MAKQPGGREAAHTVFNYVCAIRDYRLACLRYAAGLAPVDDAYHTAPPVAPLRVEDQHRLRQRLKRARLVLNGALRRAQTIDTAFECE